MEIKEYIENKIRDFVNFSNIPFEQICVEFDMVDNFVIVETNPIGIIKNEAFAVFENELILELMSDFPTWSLIITRDKNQIQVKKADLKIYPKVTFNITDSITGIMFKEYATLVNPFSYQKILIDNEDVSDVFKCILAVYEERYIDIKINTNQFNFSEPTGLIANQNVFSKFNKPKKKAFDCHLSSNVRVEEFNPAA